MCSERLYIASGVTDLLLTYEPCIYYVQTISSNGIKYEHTVCPDRDFTEKSIELGNLKQ